jgi:hypothetical protein
MSIAYDPAHFHVKRSTASPVAGTNMRIFLNWWPHHRIILFLAQLLLIGSMKFDCRSNAAHTAKAPV